MSLLSFLFPNSEESDSQWSQGQRQALVDLLYLAIYADNHLSQSEETAVRDELEKIEWSAPDSLDYYINAAIKRARDARNNEGYKNDYLSLISNHLEHDAARSTALEICQRVLSSDGSVAKEDTFLEAVRSAFGK